MAKIRVEELNPKPAKMIIKNPVKEMVERTLDDGSITYDFVEVDTFEVDGKQVQGILFVVGQDSKPFFDFVKLLAKRGTPNPGEFDRYAEEYTSMLAACIVGWEDNGFFDEPHTPEGALDLLQQPEMGWLKEQISRFMVDKSHFFTKKQNN